MKVKEITRQVQDPKLYIEIIEEGSGASFGIYTKKEIFYQEKLQKATIKSLNVQYLKGKNFADKRLLILKVKFN